MTCESPARESRLYPPILHTELVHTYAPALKTYVDDIIVLRNAKADHFDQNQTITTVCNTEFVHTNKMIWYIWMI